MEEKKFDFWQDHSVNYLNMALATENREVVEGSDGYGKRTGECGDTVEIYLDVEDGRIGSFSYTTDGCMNTDACANAVALMARGKSIAKGWEITHEAVIAYLETLAESKHHCAELTVGAFYLALSDLKKKGLCD